MVIKYWGVTGRLEILLSSSGRQEKESFFPV